jgi:hypothetical protein
MSGGRARIRWVLRLAETETETAGRGVDVMDRGQCHESLLVEMLDRKAAIKIAIQT